MAETGAVLTFSTRIDGGAPAVRHPMSGVNSSRNPLGEAEKNSFEDDLEQIDVLSLADWLERIRR
ncbi:hypothetical protein [Rhodococcus sp. NPDC006774]|uniref:hypothetical protein n=1 Tax=Rhodococcus sp. NPDC006774 TaxID=3157186 RepID=UPI00340B4103